MKLKNYAAVTHQGPFFELNEDGYDFDLDNQFFLVLDGFGGSGIGDKAVARLKDELKRFLGKLSADPEATMPLYWNARWLLEGNALINSFLFAHQNLYQENTVKPLNQRAGASMACAIKADDVLILGLVGNCFSYLVRRGKVEPLFVPDNHVWLAPDLHASPSMRVPASAFGLYPELTWALREVRVQEGDQFALFTDGVAPWIDVSELGHVLSRTDEDLQEKLNGLLKLSNARGNKANQTGMILEF